MLNMNQTLGAQGISSVEVQNQVFQLQRTDITPTQLKTTLATRYAEVTNADMIVTDGVIKFVMRAGTKGADVERVVFNNQTYTVDRAELKSNPEAIKTALSRNYPELANADYTVSNDGTMTFVMRAGTKGADVEKVVFNNQTYTVDRAELKSNPEAIKTALSRNYPELANADYTVSNDGTMTFVMRAGTKGC